MAIKQIFIYLFLAMAVFASSWLLVLNKHKTNVLPVADSKHPDLIMENVIATRMDTDGQPKSRLYSPRLLHFTTTDTTRFVQPHAIFYRLNEPPWHVFADFGQSQQDFSILLLWDNVKLQQGKTTQHLPITVTTNKLTVYPKKDIAITDQPTKMISGPNIITAKGVIAHMKTEQIDLLSKARGYYVPTH